MMGVNNPPMPMTKELRYLILEAAHTLQATPQNQAYWDACPRPKRPVGQVRFEVARQCATFVVPTLIIVGFQLWAVTWVLGLILGLPVAWFVGFMLDRQLKKDIYNRFYHDVKIDLGRYDAVRFIAHYLGMPREAVNLKFIAELAAQFPQAQAMRIEDEKRAKMARINREAGNAKFTRDAEEVAVGVASATVADTYVADDELTFVPLDMSPMVNPATGLPMTSGGIGGIDIGGSAFGFNNNQS